MLSTFGEVKSIFDTLRHVIRICHLMQYIFLKISGWLESPLSERNVSTNASRVERLAKTLLHPVVRGAFKRSRGGIGAIVDYKGL